MTYRVSLDDRQVIVRWGPGPDPSRMQQLLFGSSAEARAEYFGRLKQLATRGFIDATAADTG
jgi:predicted DNA-binding WGR domain protein